MTPPSPLRPEEKLRAIIDAQTRGGFMKFAGADIITLTFDGRVNLTYNIGGAVYGITEILLDPSGLKAAYPGIAGEARMSLVLAAILQKVKNNQIVLNSDVAAHRILESWLSNGAEAAIDTAFSLLPS